MEQDQDWQAYESRSRVGQRHLPERPHGSSDRSRLANMIYFLKHNNLIKIGYTSKIASRMSTLKNQFPGAFLMKSIAGTAAKEKAIHRLFADCRSHGEWFHSTPLLESCIEKQAWSSDKPALTPEKDAIKMIAGYIRLLRIGKNLTQPELAKKAGISMTAIRHLESGSGCSLRAFALVVIALGRRDWIASLNPYISINPLHMVNGKSRQRVRH